ncbi:15834_t:CDS:2, partial [Racocetra fulgida]
MVECNNEFEELCTRNFITFEKTSSILPWVSVFFRVNREVSLKKLENYQKAINYTYIEVRKMRIDISKKNICVTCEFKNDVEEALKENAQDKRVEKLKKITEKYGYFYASTIYFGGAIVEKKRNIQHSKINKLDMTAEIGSQIKFGNNTEFDLTIKGGIFQNTVSVIVNDPETWDIIEYHSIHSIFSLLENDLQMKVLEALGKRILRANVDEIAYFTNSEYVIHDLASQLDDIPNIKDCQIFTTIMKDQIDEHTFSTYVSYYSSFDKPMIVINRVPSKKRPK